MLSAYANSFKIPELRKRILFTFGIILLCRVTANIPCPGVDPVALDNLFSGMNKTTGSPLDMLNLFSGGALQRFAVGALGIMPYISASIIMQLMTPVIPSLERMVREGEAGRQKYQQIIRYVTLVICFIQGGIFASAMMNPAKLGLPVGDRGVVTNPGYFSFLLPTVITLTAGALFMMWLGEMITERGIGNGASLIITVNIIARLPAAILNMSKLVIGGDSDFTIIHVLILLALFFFVCCGAVALTQALRKIPIRYAKRMAGRGGSPAGATSFLPLRVNYSGVMPIIFAGAIMMFPTMVVRFLASNAFLNDMKYWPTSFCTWLATALGYGSFGYIGLYAILILGFSFFWVANQFNPIQIADDLQKRSGYIPGIRPGQPTAEYLDHTMTRITVAGAFFLLVLAVLPMLLNKNLNLPMPVAQFFGGTSILIMVGVTLDTMRQIEAHLLSRHYDGFLEKGRLRSRAGNPNVSG